MAAFTHNIGHIILMLILLCFSAFFSGSETAFFNLSKRELNQLKKSKHTLHHLVPFLLDTPGKLLSCLLLGNMTVNILFFAVSSILIVNIENRISVMAAALTAVITFIMVILLGEIIPKFISYSNSKSISILASLPAYFLTKIVSPIIFLFRFFIIDPALKLILGPTKQKSHISTEEFKSLLDASRKGGFITTDETKLLGEIVDLGLLKVRHVMRPRVDMIVCNVTESTEKAKQLMLENHLTKIPVYVETIDNIAGLVYLRQILLNPGKTLDRLVQKVHYIPEQKKVESLLQFFRYSNTDIAMVVDEYGGIAGWVCPEDIAEELLGPIEARPEISPIEQAGPFEYRLAGNLSVHDWIDAFGIENVQTRMSTLAGLVTSLLGKMPKQGDSVTIESMKLTVEKIRKHRIESVLLSFEQINNHD